jgi:hypothetical protein
MNAVLFQPTGEVRRAVAGDWIMTRGKEFYLWFFDMSAAEYPIYTRHEISEEVAQRMMEEAKP